MRKVFCHIYIVLVTLICFSGNGYALEFKMGNYFFDNSKLHFSTVKMVLGNQDSTLVFEMLPDTIDTRWLQAELSEDINNITGFCFIDSDTTQGTYHKGLTVFLDELSSINPVFRQTKIRENISTNPYNIIGWVFCPLNDAPCSDGYWRPIDSYNLVPSCTVPIIHINTQDSMPIVSKDYYINGNLWIDNCGINEFESLASEEAPLDIEIKGRGNYTWRESYKKPYKIKFAQRQTPLGLDQSKHFVLKPDFMDWSGYLRNEIGFEISRQLGMPYTTRQYPVELILNGEYEGVYFLCEKIRVESGRVDIMEQQDNDNNPDNTTGGWLLELGYEGNQVIAQFENNDPSNIWFAFVSESPEVLSQVQRDYIHDFIYRADSCIFVADKTDTGWEQYFDINSLARFYVIHEVMENVEAFSGSLFMFKDYGVDEKLNFGPVWDFDNSCLNTTGNKFIYDYGSPFSFLWIRELLKFPRFQYTIREVWKDFVDNDVLNKINEHAAEWRSLVIDAEAVDKMRWRTYASMHTEEYVTYYLNLISSKVAWLNKQWSVTTGDVNCDGAVNAADVTTIYDYLLNGIDSLLVTCDVNGDGHINSADITALYDIILNNFFPPLPH